MALIGERHGAGPASACPLMGGWSQTRLLLARRLPPADPAQMPLILRSGQSPRLEGRTTAGAASVAVTRAGRALQVSGAA